MQKSLLTTAAAMAMTIGAAQAATVTVTITEYANRADAVNAQLAGLSGLSIVAYEDFESYTADEDGNVFDSTDPTAPSTPPGSSGINPTAVGDFASISPAGCGSSCELPSAEALIRNNGDENNDGEPNFGRYDADFGSLGTPDDGKYNFLDSNDNAGITLNTLSSGQSFDTMSFILTDFDDVGAVEFGLEVHGTDVTGDEIFANSDSKGNGDIFLVQLSFSGLVSDIDVTMTTDLNDGFGADSFALAAVPLPMSGLLLIGALGALGLRARKKAA